MSAELETSIYLRCDEPADWSTDGRCTVTYGRGGNYPDSVDVLEMLARHAGREGWQVTLHNEGLKGTSAKCLCIDHARGGSGGPTP